MDNTNTSITPESKFSDSFAADYVEQTKVHLNFNQNIVIITEDRLELCLRKHLDSIQCKQAWITPVSMLGAFITTLCSSTFHDAFGLASSVWQALFVLASLLSGIWGAVAIKRSVTIKSDLTSLVQEIKKLSKTNASASDESK